MKKDKTGSSRSIRRIPAAIAVVLILAFGGLKLYESRLERQIHGALLAVYPSLKTTVRVSILGRKIACENTEFTQAEILPGFSPRYKIDEIAADQLDLAAVMRGSLNTIERLKMSGVTIITPLFTGTADEVGIEGFSGDIGGLVGLWEQAAPLEAMLEVARTLHIKRYYIKNYVIKTPALAGGVKAGLQELELTHISLSHIGPSFIKGLYSESRGQRQAGLELFAIESLDCPAMPYVLLEFFGLGAVAPEMDRSFQVKGLSIKGYQVSPGLFFQDYRQELFSGDGKGSYSLEASASGVAISPQVYGLMGDYGAQLAKAYGKPLNVDMRLTLTAASLGNDYYDLAIPDFFIEDKALLALSGKAAGVYALGGTLSLKSGDITWADKGVVEVFLKTHAPERPLTVNREAAQTRLEQMQEETQDAASREFISRLVQALESPGSLRLEFSLPEAGAIAELYEIFINQGSEAELKSSFQ